MQNQSNLYSFLKKNAALSQSAIAASRRDSDFSVNVAYEERNLGSSSPPIIYGGNVPEIKLFKDNNDPFPYQTQMNYQNNNMNYQNNKGHSFGKEQERGNVFAQKNQPKFKSNWRQDDTLSMMSSLSKSQEATKHFQSARVEAARGLQNLSRDIQVQIGNIDKKIQNFNNGILRSLTDHFKNVREQVYRMVDVMVKESQRFIFDFRRTQEQKMAGELMQIKTQLQQQFLKVEVMRGDISRQNWRKTAGEMISSELEQRVYNLIERSEGFDMRGLPWAEKTNFHLRQIQKHLRECLKLQ